METSKAIALVLGGIVAGIAISYTGLYGLHWLEEKINEQELERITQRYANLEKYNKTDDKDSE